MKKYLKLQYIVIVILIIAALGVSGFFIWRKYSETQKLIQDPTTLTETEVAKTIETVGKLILLPQGEVPTVATVSDVSKLQDQPFFVNAINGDRVLIYQQAKKAFLYRPADNKIIEVAPVNVQDNAQATPSSQVAGETTEIPAPSAAPKSLVFAIYNGTSTTGLTRSYETKLKTAYPDSTVVVRENASRNDYTTSYLVPLTDTARAQGSVVRDSLDLTVVTLPEGERVPAGADYLIILGSDNVAVTPSPVVPE